MESPNFITSPEYKKVDVFDEYIPRPVAVILNLDGLDDEAKKHYEQMKLSDRTVFVRSDVLQGIEERIRKGNAFDKKMKDIGRIKLFDNAYRILRPIFRNSYTQMDRQKAAEEEQRMQEMKEGSIKQEEQRERQRLEVVNFIEHFPTLVQKSLKEGAFLIGKEGKYYPSVEDGEASFFNAEADLDFESKRGGTWKKGLLQTIIAGSPYVRSFLPSTISGVVNSFEAELVDTNVVATLRGNSFSTFGDNELFFTMKYKENGEEKEIHRSFKPF